MPIRLFILLILLPGLSACLPGQTRPSVHVEKDMFLSRSWTVAALDLYYSPLAGQQKSGLVTSASAGTTSPSSKGVKSRNCAGSNSSNCPA